MAISNYNPPSIKKTNFIVNRKFIKAVYDLMLHRFGVKEIKIEVCFTSGDDTIYDNLEEFGSDIHGRLEMRESIVSIKIVETTANPKDLESLSKNYVMAILSVDFDFQSLYYSITGQNLDQDKKDWAIGFYREIEKVFSAFDLAETGKNIIFDFSEPIEKSVSIINESKQPEKINSNNASSGIVSFDDENTARFSSEVSSEPVIKNSWSTSWWGKFILAIIAGLLILIIWYFITGAK